MKGEKEKQGRIESCMRVFHSLEGERQYQKGGNPSALAGKKGSNTYLRPPG